jgi:predicted HTH transcriptional regulator
VKKILLETSPSPQTKLQEHHQMILTTIQEKGFITDREYAALVERAKATRRLDFNKLIEMGLIVRRGKGKNTYYELSGKTH